MPTLIISVDLSNWGYRQAIQEYLCKLQSKDRSIVSIVYDEENDVVRVSGTFDPKALTIKLDAKLRDINIRIQEPRPPPDESKPPPSKLQPEPSQPKPEPPPKAELPPTPPKPQMDPWPPKPPMYPWPPQVTMVYFAHPCPCLTAWSNNYRCCSCRMQSWPGRCGSGSGSRWGSGPRLGDRLQWGCEPSQQPNIVFESTPNIAYESTEQWGWEPSQQPNIIFESMPNIAYESTEQWGCEPSQKPNIIFESTPNIAYESTEPSCSIM